jgi:hypothetical protein
MEGTLADYMEIDSFIRSHAGSRFAFYGAGVRTLEYFANSKLESQKFPIFDIDNAKIGTAMGGNTVQNPEKIRADEIDYIFIMVVGYEEEVTSFLKSKNIPTSKMIFLKSSSELKHG